MTPTPLRPFRRWLAGAGATVALAGVLAGVSAAAPVDGTTPDSVVAGTDATTPTTPELVTPSLSGPATVATGDWVAPTTITEESKFSLFVAGEIDGQATGHIALLKDVAACPVSPLYPRQIATGYRVPLLGKGPIPVTSPPTLGATYTATLIGNSKNSGAYRLCGWVVAFPASSEGSTLTRFDQAVVVENKVAQLSADVPVTSRAGDYFTVKLSGVNPGSGRRALVMAEPNQGQSCEAMRKAPSGKRALQSVIGLPSGTYTKNLRLRYRSKTAGPYLVCIQIVESADRAPEAVTTRLMDVTEGLKCVRTKAAVAQRSSDLTVIRRRRDAAKQRVAKAKKQLAPATRKASKQRKISNRRIAKARKAYKSAKSAAGKKKTRARYLKVRKAEQKKIYRAERPLRKARGSLRMHQRTYNQYRKGAALLMDTIKRTSKDLKKYCANP